MKTKGQAKVASMQTVVKTESMQYYWFVGDAQRLDSWWQ